MSRMLNRNWLFAALACFAALVWTSYAGAASLDRSSAATAVAASGPTEVRAPTISFHILLGHSKRPERDVHLAVQGDVAILYVRGGRLHEVPFDEWTKYAVHPASTPTGSHLEVEFGEVGAVSLGFRPSGEVRVGHDPEGCIGKRPRREVGNFRGSIALRGEGDYFALHGSLARGVRVRTFPLRCEPGDGATATEDEPLAPYVTPNLAPGTRAHAVLETVTEGKGLIAGFDAWQGIYDYEQSGVVETRPEMAVGHYYLLGFPILLRTSSSGPGRLAGTVGDASYNSDPTQPKTWSGPLETELPDGHSVLLNGPGSRTRLCVGPSRNVAAECVGEPAPVLSGGPFAPPAP
jgi:hypothetical protein